MFDFQKVVDLISEEVSDQCKYVKLDKPVEKKMEDTRKKIVSTVLAQEMVGNITGKDKTTITGLNEQNNMKHNPEYRAVPPKIWPLFKVHKLSQLQIEQKVTPPQRFINAAKHGPLYRLGQWSSPHLTKISRAYCGEEFILDTPHLLRQIEDFNREPSSGNLLLATLDVEALYPSINPQLALSAITEAFAEDSTTSYGIKTALREFIELGFEESFVTFRGSCYKPLIGIPTGGCDSRQIADIFLHWLLFTKIKDNISQWSFVKLFRRFIDDGFLIWKGTKRQFSLFVTNLNAIAETFGIRFGSWEIGKSVNFLDLTLYLDDQNKVQYKIYTKPTDARNYLRTDSFHPPHVFRSVAFSQMLRVVSRNSQDGTRFEDMEQLKKDLKRSGHELEKLEDLEPLVYRRYVAPEEDSFVSNTDSDSLVFPVNYMREIPELKKVLKETERIVQPVLGDTTFKVATRKGTSIGNRVLRNSAIGKAPVGSSNQETQKCTGSGCKCCRHMGRSGDTFNINNGELTVPSRFNCKTENCIYMAQCNLCSSLRAEGISLEDTYFGQTTQKFHKRINGHRACFNAEDYKKSALSLHAMENHPDHFDINIYKMAVLREVNPRCLNREEFRYIEKFRTNSFGLNRCKVER